MNLRPYVAPYAGVINACYLHDGITCVQVERKRSGLAWLNLDLPAINQAALSKYGLPLGSEKIWKAMQDRGELSSGATWAHVPDTRTWATMALGQRPFDAAIKAALAAGHAVSWSLPINGDVQNPALVKVPAPARNSPKPYAHALTIVDWIGEYLICAGSTQANIAGWKDGGFAWMQQDWLAERLDGSLGTFMYLTSIGVQAPTQPQGGIVTKAEVLAALKQQWSDADKQEFIAALAGPPMPPPVPPQTGVIFAPPAASVTEVATGAVFSLGSLWWQPGQGYYILRNGQQVRGVAIMLARDSAGKIWMQAADQTWWGPWTGSDWGGQRTTPPT